MVIVSGSTGAAVQQPNDAFEVQKIAAWPQQHCIAIGEMISSMCCVKIVFALKNLSISLLYGDMIGCRRLTRNLSSWRPFNVCLSQLSCHKRIWKRA